MTTQPNDQTEHAQPGIRLGASCVSNGLAHLWKKSPHSLSIEALKWFANFTDQTEAETNNLARMLMELACLIGTDEHTGGFQDNRPLSDLLFNLSHQIDTINGMIHIGGRTEDRLKNPDYYKELGGAA